jgi:7,8-dihydro-6-hydroxymethylpterin dimethyltransferase
MNSSKLDDNYPGHNSQASRLARLAGVMQRNGLWSDGQAAGRRWTIGCVSLEITQRCNLDCTLCYLSDSAEAIADIPLPELFRRIDEIAHLYGPNTDVQISGGDPTLRDKQELSQIIRYVRSRAMRASLFTNGILLTRAWLETLISDGLNDVAFHVDMTQERKGYTSEAQLNQIRSEYIEMARGLPVSVIFNTTVFDKNVHEVASLTDFFISHCDVVRFASFQLGADTGRGVVAGSDPTRITQQSVWQAIQRGAATKLNYNALEGGHHQCNRYALLLSIGKQRFDALKDGPLVAQVMRDTAQTEFSRDQRFTAVWALLRALLRRPRLLSRLTQYAVGIAWQARSEFFQNGRVVPKVGKISFFTHSFMDADALCTERVDSCVFMAATAQGPMSMCSYNAQREGILRQPIRLADGQLWQPIALASDVDGNVKIPVKWLKGKQRAAVKQNRPSL